MEYRRPGCQQARTQGSEHSSTACARVAAGVLFKGKQLCACSAKECHANDGKIFGSEQGRGSAGQGRALMSSGVKSPFAGSTVTPPRPFTLAGSTAPLDGTMKNSLKAGLAPTTIGLCMQMCC